MKKYLFILLFSLVCIIPFNVSAETKYIYKKSPLTETQKKEYIDLVLSMEEFKSGHETYPYYLIFYQESINYPLSMNYENNILFYFYETPPVISQTGAHYNLGGSKYRYKYNLSNSSLQYNGSYGAIYIMPLISADTYYYNGDYILATNIPVSFDFSFDLNDTNDNYVKTIIKETNIFEGLDVFNQLEVDVDYTIDDILNSEDTLYNLSKELIGPLPEEFNFIYSIVSLMLGLLVLIVVISPFVLLKRWLM